MGHEDLNLPGRQSGKFPTDLVRIVPGENFTPLGLAKKLNAKCILESSSYQKGRERYSLLMLREAFRVSQIGSDIFLEDRETKKKYRVQSKARDILDVLGYFSNQHTPPHQDFPYPAGGIGYLSFEFCRFCDTISLSEKPDPLDMPDALFLFGHVFLVFDHYTDLLYIIGLNYAEKSIDLQVALNEVEQRINDGDQSYLQDEDADYAVERISDSSVDEMYKDFVEKMRVEVVKGNLLQGVPSRRLQYRTELPALEAYRRLRRTNPSPYLFYINFEDFELFGASPEVHCKVKEGRATVRPIAGTRRRSVDKEEDRRLEAELLADPKERAEHLMLVDLGRNDLGRVCKPGSVQVSEYMLVERYSHVMHIVSQVEGDLLPGKQGSDALRATFPAGTVSGAPKIQAIKTIDALEPHKRRFYSGVVGYFEPGGGMDTCITIRSAVKKGDVLTLQAGGGIVFDSRPERELEETNEKLGALLRSIGVESATKEVHL